MLTTIFAALFGTVVAVGAIVVTVARAITPMGRGDLSLQDDFSGPPAAAPAFAEWQRLELQFEMANDLGGLDAGSLETLRQDVAMARSRYEGILAASAVAEFSPEEQLDAAAAAGDCLTKEQLRDAEAAVSDCLTPAPALKPAIALGTAAAIVPIHERLSARR